MKTKRLKGNIINKILIVLILLVLVSTLILTLAYFQDKKEYSGTLDFGNIKLKVSGGVEGDGVTTSTSKLVFDTARKKNNDPTWTGKYMPGDLVEINLTIGLEENSEPAYYMVFISDENEYFETSAYYGIKDSSGNLKIYKSDGQKVVLQSDNSEQTNIYCGKITKTETHNLTISAKIKDELETQGTSTTVSCKVCAIQQANLTEEDAQIELNLNGSANILPINYNVANTTIDGITITNNGDKTFTLNGTATGNCFPYTYLGLDNINKNVNGEYLVVFGISGTIGKRTYAQVVCDGNWLASTRFGTTRVELNGTLTRFYIVAYKDEIVTNFVIKPQLIKLY